jgi:hypothetical protein
MASFTRTVPGYKGEEHVLQILSCHDHFIPLVYRPVKARAGDFIYLIYKGQIVSRARISAIVPFESRVANELEEPLHWARWIIRYSGRWEKPPRTISVRGHQSIRYLETHSLSYLDTEVW